MIRRFYVYLLILLMTSTGLYAASHRPEEFLNKIKGSKNEGKQIYEHFCVTCHAPQPLIALGAPRFANESDWNDRLKQDLDVLLKNTEEGFNAMPPRGGCFECTDEQLALAIITMIPKKSKKDLYNALRAHKKSTK